MKLKDSRVLKIKSIFFILVVGSVLVFLGLVLFVFDIGINSQFFIKKDFNKAFLYRKTGNCQEFVKYVSMDKAGWLEKCIQEKNAKEDPIESYKVLEITKYKDHAFLQSEIKRDTYFEERDLAEDGHKIPQGGYLVNYEMERNNGRWYISQDANR